LISLFFIKNIFSYSKTTTNLENDIILEIPKLSSLYEIATILENKNVINNKYSFIIYSIFSGYSKQLKAGEYIFSKDSTKKSILSKLYTNKVKLYKVLIPECYSNKQIYFKLSNYFTDLKTKKIFTEGDFFPSTYYFSKDTKIESLLDMMNRKAENNFTKIYNNYKENVSNILKNKKEVLILASIVEAEAKFKDEKKKIAAVFLNRLKVGMKLQSDPTVIYGIHKQVNKRNILSKNDLLINHKWNTYKIYGLPPTPICNVGIDAFYAVLNPEKNDYMYFVSDKKGRHIFSKTYKEHRENIKNIYKK
tara:strand:- start:9252 stop:10169 length:918 start_codon:yes stop_codon:yes gene_type:complete